MSTKTLTCGCKLNLGLRITGTRPDGLHELDSLFYPLKEPFDTLLLTENGSGTIRLFTGDKRIDPEKNTLCSAYTAFRKRVQTIPGLDVTLNKGIPLGAGLGGGSSDAACLLTFLKDTYATSLPAEELQTMALETGSDVPFFLQTEPCRVRGTGDILTPAEPLIDSRWGELLLLLVSPSCHIDTGWAYRRYDTIQEEGRKQEVHALTKKGFAIRVLLPNAKEPQTVLPWTLDNDLEKAVLPAHPELAALKNRIFAAGALACAMSGSGASLYAFFEQKKRNKIDELRALLSTDGHYTALARFPAAGDQ
ncbi:MAG: 4-(cytidine 5'-diphospho)-2-C-methyl-D-erythritol kinase [Desulfovibrio sp.]|nr:4-(cytidine 5'-diphospho)-2-C-methyl-D-erythritol kinase [Desulfovibrio sp.]